MLVKAAPGMPQVTPTEPHWSYINNISVVNDLVTLLEQKFTHICCYIMSVTRPQRVNAMLNISCHGFSSSWRNRYVLITICNLGPVWKIYNSKNCRMPPNMSSEKLHSMYYAVWKRSCIITLGAPAASWNAVALCTGILKSKQRTIALMVFHSWLQFSGKLHFAPSQYLTRWFQLKDCSDLMLMNLTETKWYFSQTWTRNRQ